MKSTKTQLDPNKNISKASVRLPRQVKNTLDDFQHRVLERFPNQINRIILYGSYASGRAAVDSDIDVLVVVKWEDTSQPGEYYIGKPGDPIWREIVNAAADSMVLYGSYISPVVIGEKLFNSSFAIAQSAKTEGKVLWMSP